MTRSCSSRAWRRSLLCPVGADGPRGRRAPTPPWPGGPKSGRRRSGVQRFPTGLAGSGERYTALGSAPLRASLTKIGSQPGSGALRAPLI